MSVIENAVYTNTNNKYLTTEKNDWNTMDWNKTLKNLSHIYNEFDKYYYYKLECKYSDELTVQTRLICKNKTLRRIDVFPIPKQDDSREDFIFHKKGINGDKFDKIQLIHYIHEKMDDNMTYDHAIERMEEFINHMHATRDYTSYWYGEYSGTPLSDIRDDHHADPFMPKD